jgi:hypothetical protein
LSDYDVDFVAQIRTIIWYIQVLLGHKHNNLCACYHKKHSENQVAIRRLGDLKQRRYYVTKSTHYFQNVDIFRNKVIAINKLPVMKRSADNMCNFKDI